MTSRQVWVIGSGDYSDYRVAAVAESRELADRVADLIGCKVRSCAWDDDDGNPVTFFVEGDELPTVYSTWSCEINGSGVAKVEEREHSTFYERRAPETYVRRYENTGPSYVYATAYDYDTADAAERAAREVYGRAVAELQEDIRTGKLPQ